MTPLPARLDVWQRYEIVGEALTAEGRRVLEEARRMVTIGGKTVEEPLRDRIGRALYEEPGKMPDDKRDWYALHEERREPWRRDADRVLALLADEGRLREPEVRIKG